MNPSPTAREWRPEGWSLWVASCFCPLPVWWLWVTPILWASVSSSDWRWRGEHLTIGRQVGQTAAVILFVSELPPFWKRSLSISVPKKDNTKGCLNYHCAHFAHCKIMLKIPQARLQQYVNWELPDAQAGFRKGRGTTDHIANVHWMIGKAREYQKNIYYCFIDYANSFNCVDYNKLENSSRDGNTRSPSLPPDKSACRSRSNS